MEFRPENPEITPSIGLAAHPSIHDNPAPPRRPQADERSMGRETKILLALLATLSGVFLGVLSMKLLVPRPPVGAGVDVHIDVASTGSNALVEPPALTPPPAAPDHRSLSTASGFAAADASGDLLAPSASSTAGTMTSDPVGAETVHDIDSPQHGLRPQAVPVTSQQDPLVMPASLQRPEDLMDRSMEARSPGAVAPAGEAQNTALRGPLAIAPDGLQSPSSPQQTPYTQLPAVVSYGVGPGDSWWDLAERAYGDGRLYRALFAWNRVLDPRVSLAPGTRLEFPPRARLEAAWPKLIPQ